MDGQGTRYTSRPSNHQTQRKLVAPTLRVQFSRPLTRCARDTLLITKIYRTGPHSPSQHFSKSFSMVSVSTMHRKDTKEMSEDGIHLFAVGDAMFECIHWIHTAERW
jgi:hypothetical protein